MSGKHSAQRIVSLLLISAVLCPAHDASLGKAHCRTQSGYRLRSYVIGSAGSRGESTSFKNAGTLGQSTAVGVGSAGGTSLRAGFWGRYWIPTTVDEIPAVHSTMLHQNYPNPFNPSTIIKYSLAVDSRVEIIIFTVSGQKLRTLVNEMKRAGKHSATWDGRNDGGRPVASGIYFYRMKSNGFSAVKKMLLIR